MRNECIILYAFKHNYILDILYPPLSNIINPMPNNKLETIVVSKYGWESDKRNLLDLLIEINKKTWVIIMTSTLTVEWYPRTSVNPNTSPEWSQKEVNDIAWDVVKSLLKGIQNLHGAATSPTSNGSFSSYFKCVVHRDIKLNNIGIKRNADGHVSLNCPN